MKPKITSLIISLLILNFTPMIAQNTIKTGGKLEHVTVYPNRASIQKSAVINLKKGENEILLTGISPYLTDGSFQILIPNNNVSISDISTQISTIGGKDSKRVIELKEQISNLDKQISSKSSQQQVYRGSIAFYHNTNPFSSTQKTSQSEIINHVGFVEEKVSEYYALINQLEVEVQALKEERTQLQKELDTNQKNKANYKNVLVRVSSSTDMNNLNIDYSYITSRAGWSSQYDIKASTNGNDLSIDYYVALTQSTGEDWENIPIEVSTLSPAQYGDIPELTPWYIDRVAMYAMKTSNLRSRAMLAEASYDMADGAVFEESEVIESATSFQFVLPSNTSVVSDNQPHRSMISSKKLHSDITYAATPLYNESVYLKTQISSPFDYPMISGKMNVYLDGQYAGNTYLSKDILPKESLNIALGTDKSIKVKRELKNKNTQYAGIANKNTIINYDYLITVTNGKNKEIELDITDRLPLSLNEKVKITIRKPQNNEASIDDKGIATWHLKIPKNESKTIQISFTIEHPKDVQIND